MSAAPIGIIGGTGFGRIADIVESGRIEARTSYGMPSGPVVQGTIAGRAVAFLARHGTPHRIAPHRVNYRANIIALKDAGVREVVAINAVGGIADWASAGAIAAPTQLIDYTHGRLSSFSDFEDLAVDHVDFTDPFSEPLRQRPVLPAWRCMTAAASRSPRARGWKPAPRSRACAAMAATWSA